MKDKGGIQGYGYSFSTTLCQLCGQPRGAGCICTEDSLEVMVDRVMRNCSESCPICDYDGIWETHLICDGDRREAIRGLLRIAIGTKDI